MLKDNNSVDWFKTSDTEAGISLKLGNLHNTKRRLSLVCWIASVYGGCNYSALLRFSILGLRPRQKTIKEEPIRAISATYRNWSWVWHQRLQLAGFISQPIWGHGMQQAKEKRRNNKPHVHPETDFLTNGYCDKMENGLFEEIPHIWREIHGFLEMWHTTYICDKKKDQHLRHKSMRCMTTYPPTTIKREE